MTANFCSCRLASFAGAVLFLLAAGPAAAQYSGDSYAYEGSERYSTGNGAFSPQGSGYGGDGAYAQPQNGYGVNEGYTPRGGYGANDAYSGGADAYSPRGGYGGNDAYSQGGDAYSPRGYGQNDRYGDSAPGYGEPYAPPPQGRQGEYYEQVPAEERTYSQNEIVSAGHSFFGAISQNLASAVEYAFGSQGRPNGYILGEDAGGAFVFGLRYGEGRLYTKDAGDHKVFWQGPSLGYDAGAEGSKTMVLVYNLRDPSEIYKRFGGVQGAAYLVGGLSVQFQKYGDVTLAVIRSGVGVRLGANVGYLKYTRRPTWNPL